MKEDFSETIAACDLKVGRCRQLVDLMKRCEYSRSGNLLTLAHGHLHIEIKICILAHLSWRLTRSAYSIPVEPSSVDLWACSHFQTRISPQPAGRIQPNFI